MAYREITWPFKKPYGGPKPKTIPIPKHVLTV